jgi:hypothetical protein
MFKIDYFDQTMSIHSPDPADPAVTRESSRSCSPRNTRPQGKKLAREEGLDGFGANRSQGQR